MLESTIKLTNNTIHQKKDSSRPFLFVEINFGQVLDDSDRHYCDKHII